MGLSFVHVHLVALRYFGETVRAGSMRQAAEQLNVAASAINRQVRKLEEQLQCQLFDRTAEGVRLTAAGEVLYHYILRLDRDLNRAIVQIDDLRGLRRGHVRLACSDGIGRDFLPYILSGFHEEFPGITYSVEVASALHILAQVADGEIDIGLAMAPPTRADVAIAARAEMPMGVIMPKDSPLRERKSLKLADLVGERFIQAKDGTGGGNSYHALLATETPYGQLIETNSPDFITNLVEVGLGIGIRTPVGIMQSVEDGKVGFVLLEDPLIALPSLAIYSNPRRSLSTAGALMLERLSQSLPEFSRRVWAVGRPALLPAV